jgi:type I restriction enzyme M protein
VNTSTIVQKLGNYCNVLRDDGMSYGDYVEQLTYLLFLKMADERTRQLLLRCPTSRHPWRSRAPYNQKSPVPEQYSWPSLGNCSMRCSTSCIHAVVIRKAGDELFYHYRHILEALGNQKGLLGLIFNKSQNTIFAGRMR